MAEDDTPELRDDVLRTEKRISAEILGSDDGSDPFVAAVRATRMPMIVTNPRLPDNPVVFVNDAFCRLTGYGRPEILGRNCRFLQGDGTDRETVARIHDAVERRVPIEIDIRNFRKTGEPFWNRLLIAPVYDAAGELSYFFASQVDVTLERERLQNLESSNAALMAELAGRLAEQQERERELHFTLDAGGFGAWQLTLADHALTSSPRHRVNFGVGEDEAFTLADLKARIVPEDRGQMAAALQRSIATGEDYVLEYRIVLPGGERRWIAMRGHTIHDADGTPVRMGGISVDITQQKRATQFRETMVEVVDALRSPGSPDLIAHDASRLLGQAIGASRVGFGTIDAATEQVTIARDWVAEGTGHLEPVIALRRFGSFVDDLKRGETVVIEDVLQDERTSAHGAAFAEKGVRALVNVPVLEAGTLVAMLFVNDAQPRRWRDDELDLIEEVADRTRTATGRRRAEQELAELAAGLEQQVTARTGELMIAEEALRQSQKMEAIGQLTGGVAHDFNNLLTVIRSSVDLLRRPGLPEERRDRYLGAISDTVDRAARLTGQLLAFARRQALQPQPFDAGRQLDTVAEIVRTLAGSRVVVEISRSPEVCCVNADPTQFDTAIVNMAVNARDAMNGEGRLTLSVEPASSIPPEPHGHAIPGAFVAICIADTGSGIERDNLARIFEPFFTTKGVGKGTGLGLSQVFGFAKQSGGEVRVDSAPGEGTRIMLYLPRTDPPATSDAPERDEHAGSDGAGIRVLVVEDNAEVGSSTVQALAELGYVPLLATDGAAALAELERDPARFDVVFSDVVMPGMSGVELAQAVRTRFPDLTLLLTSGYSDVLARHGTFGFELLHKPYSIAQLSTALRRSLADRDRD